MRRLALLASAMAVSFLMSSPISQADSLPTPPYRPPNWEKHHDNPPGFQAVPVAANYLQNGGTFVADDMVDLPAQLHNWEFEIYNAGAVAKNFGVFVEILRFGGGPALIKRNFGPVNLAPGGSMIFGPLKYDDRRMRGPGIGPDIGPVDVIVTKGQGAAALRYGFGVYEDPPCGGGGGTECDPSSTDADPEPMNLDDYIVVRVTPSVEVPALSHWGGAVLVILLSAVGVFSIRALMQARG